MAETFEIFDVASNVPSKNVSQRIQKHFLLLGLDFCFGNIVSSLA